MITLIIDNKKGNVTDISDLILDGIQVKTYRIAQTSELTFQLTYGDPFSLKYDIQNGYIVSFYHEKDPIFKGIVVKIEQNKDGYTITVYDQLFYLQAKDVRLIHNVTFEQFLTQLCQDFNLQAETFEATNYIFFNDLQDNQKLIDMISDCIGTLITNTGIMYVLYDDFGKLTLKSIQSLKTDYVLSTYGNITDYTYSKDIATQTYTVFRLGKNDDSTGVRSYLQNITDKAQNWGLIQYYDTVDAKYTDAQMKEQLDTLTELYNDEVETISVTSIGVNIRAGNSVYADVLNNGTAIFMLVEECEHTFGSGNDWTMSLKLRRR